MASESQTRATLVEQYLYNKSLSDRKLIESVNAFRKASSEVTCMQNGEYWKSTYSDKVNRKLHEALTVMYCDPDCDSRNVNHLKRLIEDYREMHGMADAPLVEPEIQVMIPAVQDEIAEPAPYDIAEVTDCDLEDCILDMSSVGEYVSYDALCNELAETEEDKVAILDALKELVRQGHLEVTQRDQYNGSIQTCLRIR